MNREKLWNLGYLISIVALILAFLFRENRTVAIISVFVFCVSVSVTYVNKVHNKMKKQDAEYRVMVDDERNEKIRDKVNSSMCAVLMFANLCVAIVALIFRENISAILLTALVLVSPLIMLGFSYYFEKKY